MRTACRKKIDRPSYKVAVERRYTWSFIRRKKKERKDGTPPNSGSLKENRGCPPYRQGPCFFSRIGETLFSSFLAKEKKSGDDLLKQYPGGKNDGVFLLTGRRGGVVPPTARERHPLG